MKLFASFFARVAAQTIGIDKRVRCDNCPNWRPIGEQRIPAVDIPCRVDEAPNGEVIVRQPERIHTFGACSLESLVMASYPQLGAAQYIRYGHDFCAKHPRHEAVPVAGLGFAPEGEIDPAKMVGPFNRSPALHEARQLDTRKRLPADE